MNGYCDCSCPNCFEIAIGEKGKALCNLCESAGCDGEGDCCVVDLSDEAADADEEKAETKAWLGREPGKGKP